MNAEQAAKVADISRQPIELADVDSSQIAAIGHDAATNTLAVRFQPRAGFDQGALYHYANVTPEAFEQFRTAPSIGSHFHRNIKPNSADYPYVRIEADKTSESEAA